MGYPLQLTPTSRHFKHRANKSAIEWRLPKKKAARRRMAAFFQAKPGKRN
jgi:hypothetical protein